ncbi:MAG TPA: hypothetical protein PKC67_05975 [Kiritimatiellia bacterium]|nr:hypothetical protein [Kiritimatiellia bacterium]HMP33883.1 hypothetical protein [Kiritimatiellia bacterium]
MERGVKALLRILFAALLLGLLVIAFHPAYRVTAQALWRGDVSASPIAGSNQAYYPDVVVGEGTR